MAKASPALQAFNAGELSAQVSARTDIDKYKSGCATLENFIPTVQGPVIRRPGTTHAANVKDSTARTWLRRFQSSSTTAFHVEFGDHYCRFFTDNAPVAIPAGTPWATSTVYALGQVVTRLGVSYSCKVAHTSSGGTTPPSSVWYAMTGGVYEIYSPFSISQLTNSDGHFAPQVEQSADVLYMTIENLPVQELQHLGTAQWGFVAYAPVDGPFMDQGVVNNADPVSNIAMYISATSYDAAGNPLYTITSTQPVFSATDAGSVTGFQRLIRLETQNYTTHQWEPNVHVTAGDYLRHGTNTYKALTTGVSSSVAPVHTYGTAWDGGNFTAGTLSVLWLYVDSGYGIANIVQYTSSTQVLVTPTYDTKNNFTYNFPKQLFVNTAPITGITRGTTTTITAANTFATGDAVFITGVTGTTQVNDRMYTVESATGANFVLSGIDSTGWTAYTAGGSAFGSSTVRWQLGEWSDTTAYPHAVGFDSSDRLFFSQGIKLWGSVPGQYTSHAQDFHGQVTTDAALNVSISANEVSNVLWLKSANILLIGTDGGEFGLSPITTTAALGPDNVKIARQSQNRCRAMSPLLIGTSVFYVQRAGRRVLSMDYNFYVDRYDSSNQNRLAQHITIPNLIDWTWAQEPNFCIWAARSDGQLIGYTYNKEDQVQAWHRHIIGGNGIVESVSSALDDDASHDQVWMIVRRTVNGTTVRSIEYIAEEYLSGDAQNTAFYVDNGYTYNGAPTTSITGLTWLANQTCSVFVDGGVHPPVTVSAGGVATLNYAGSVVSIGLPYTSTLKTMRIDAGADIGTSQGKTKRIAIATIRLVDSLPGYIGMDGHGDPDLMFPNDPATMLNNPVPFITGDIAQMSFPGELETDCQVVITQADPGPMTIAGFFPNLEGNEPQ